MVGRGGIESGRRGGERNSRTGSIEAGDRIIIDRTRMIDKGGVR